MADDVLDPLVDEAALAQEGFAAAAERVARRYRRNPDQPPEVPADRAVPAGGNFFDQFDAEADAGEPGLRERARLNALDAFYRGTLAGSGRLAMMASQIATPDDDPSSTPEMKKVRTGLKSEYDEIVADLARYDLMRGFGTTAEAAVALAGQLGGSLPSPESVAGVASKGATALIRTGRAALQQSGIMAVTDPAVQALSIRGGVEDRFSVERWMGATALGGLIGGGLHGAGEVVGHQLLKREMARLAEEDDSLRSAMWALDTRTYEAGSANVRPVGGLPPAQGPVAPEAVSADPMRPVPDTAMTPAERTAASTREPQAPAATPPPQTGEASPAAPPEPVIHRVSTPSGQSVEVKPMVVEARDLITSSDEGYDATLQPRDRDRAASQAQIRDIAANLDPERLGFSAEADRGAPIVGPDNMVESGNGRIMAIRQAYDAGGDAAQRYRDWIASQGIDVSGFEQPVLVRQRVTELAPEDRRAFTVGANQGATLTFSASERALADSRSITPDQLDLIRNPDDLGAIANRDFVRSFVGKLPQAEQGAMMNAEGGLSSEGMTRIRNAVIAAAYGDAPVLARISEATSDEIRSISNALVAAAPTWAKLRADVAQGLVRADIDQTAALVEAVSRTADIRAKGQKLDAFLAQQDAFDRLAPAVEDFMRMFYDASGRRAAGANRIVDALRFYAEEGRKVTDGGLDLGLPPVSVGDLQRTAREKASGPRQAEGTLFLRRGPRDGAGAEARGGAVPGRRPGEPRGDARATGAGGDQGRQERTAAAQLSRRPDLSPENQALIARRDVAEDGVAALPRDGREIRADVTDKLLAVGMSPDEAAANAAVVAARYVARAERLGDGRSAIDLYRGEGIEIGRGAGDVVDGRSFQQPARVGDVTVDFPDPDHLALYDLGRRIVAGGEVADAEAERLLRRFKGFMVEDDTSPLNSVSDMRDAALEYFRGVDEEARKGKPFEAWDTIEPDEKARWFRRALEEARTRRPGRKAGRGSPDEGQMTFFQEGRSPTFYSAVARAVDEVKVTKASPDQWMATIRNQPGVKAEEIKWLGLEDWLGRQNGSVAKEQLQDYVFANELVVREVQHGGDAGRELDAADALRERLEEAYDVSAEKITDRGETVTTSHAFSHLIAIGAVDPSRVPAPLRSLAQEFKVAYDRYDQAISRLDGDPRHAEYVLPGGENYRELVLTLPGRILPYTPDQIHFTDDGGGTAVAWVRFNDRVIDGQRALLIEEVQSKRHQDGRRKGYQGEKVALDPLIKADAEARHKWLSAQEAAWRRFTDGKASSFTEAQDHGVDRKVIAAARKFFEEDPEFFALYKEQLRTHDELAIARQKNQQGVPDAPFKTTWPELAVKRMLRWAAENGYDKVAWVPGAAQAERYDLSRHIEELRAIRRPTDGKFFLGYRQPGSPADAFNGMSQGGIVEADVANYVGKELADKIIAQKPGESVLYSGLDLKVGGEGMHEFYDKILPSIVNKLVKKFGAKVERGEIDTGRKPDERWEIIDATDAGGDVLGTYETRAQAESAAADEFDNSGIDIREAPAAIQSVHVVDITPELRKAALEQGFPLFQPGEEGGPRGRITLSPERAVIDLFEKADASTFMHESAHLWLDELVRDAAAVPEGHRLKADLATVLDWLGVEAADDIKVPQHEQWARAFEQYLADGTAPSSALAKAFDAFKRWLTAIYRQFADLDVRITDDVRGVMDRMLATDAEIAAARSLPELPQGARVVSDSPFGPAIEGLEDRWADALAWLRQARTGDVRGVLAHADVPGRIDVVWGGERWGMQHIDGKHPGDADALPALWGELAVVRADEKYIELASDRASAVVARDFAGDPKNWLLTFFQLKGEGRRAEGLSAASAPKGAAAQSPPPPPDGTIAELRATDQPPGVEEIAELASRQGGGALQMERRRPNVGVPSVQGQGTGTALTSVPQTPAPKDVAIRSLQQQAFDFAEAIGFPLRQGRITSAGALGITKVRSGVVRVREVPDFEVVAHEAGHFIEMKVGPDLTALTNQFGIELAPLVSNPAAYDPSKHVMEGFAEWIRRYIGNPAHARQVAPGFAAAFRGFMRQRAPAILATIDGASEAYRAYLDAPSVDAVHAVIRSRDEEPPGFRGVLKSIREEGFPAVIGKAIEKSYDAVLDRFAPAARAVREAAVYIRETQGGAAVKLKAADNPEIHLRLLARSQQAAVLDMTQGVRPYHKITPNGPSLRDALAKAVGDFSAWGKWDPDLKSLFSDYLVARRAEFLWRRFDAGDLPNPPAAFGRADARVAMAELEAANPTFREAADMVHAYSRELLRKSYQGGLIGQDLYQKLLEQEFYVPFLRDMRDKPLAGGGGSSGARDRVADVVMRMKGSARDIKDPIESLMLQTFLVNRTLRHNDMIRAFVRYFGRAGIEGGRYVETIPAHEAKRYTFDLMGAVERAAKEHGIDPDDTKVLLGSLSDVFGEDPIMGSFFKMEPAGKRGEPIVFYKEGGELKAARFMAESEGHGLYELVTALPAGLADTAAQALAVTAGVVRSGIVTNPVFMLTNFIRDQVAAGILRPDYVPFLHGTKGIWSELKQEQSAALYGYAGGVSAGSHIAPLEQAITLDPQALKAQGYVSSRVQSLHGLLELASITEAGTRNSIFETVFRQKKAQGLSDYEAMFEAAWQAQDIIDFSRRGSKTMWIVAATPFFNATTQGLDKARRVLFEPIARRVTNQGFVLETDREAFRNAMLAWTKLLGVGGVLGAAWAAVHQDDPIYRNANAETMGTHFVTSVGGKMIVIPKPFELGLGFTAGEYAYKRLMQEDPRAAAQFAEAAWEVLLPPIPVFDNPAIKTTAELAAGVSFYPSLFKPRQLVPDTLKRLPAEMQFTDRTSSAAKAIGKTIGVSPIKVDYAVGAYFGLWGRDIMAMSSGVDETAPARSWADMALTRRFIKDPSRQSDVTAKFWDFMGATTGQYNQAVAAHSELVNRKSPESDAAAADYLASLPASQKSYVILRNAADEDGKPAFTADQRRLHPLQRAYDAVTVLNGLRREFDKDSFAPYATGERRAIDRNLRGQVRDVVRELAQTEMYNALITVGEPGYANQPRHDTAPIMEKIRKLDPAIADEIATRYATAKVYPDKAVAAAWPRLKAELLRAGSEADLADLVAEASEGGFEFGAERSKKPRRRRVPIAPARPN